MIRRLSRAYMKGHGGLLGIFRLKTRRESRALSILMGFLMAYMVIVFSFGFFNMFSVMLLSDIRKAFMMVILYSVIGSMSLLFSESVELYRTGKDLESLFSFPISRRDVMLSRFLVLFEYDFFMTLVLIIPFTLSGALLFNAGTTWFLGSGILSLSLSLFSSSLMTFLAIVIPRKLRKPVYVVCTVAFIYIALRYGLAGDTMDTLLSTFRGGFEKMPIGGMPLLLVSIALLAFSALFLLLSAGKFNLSERHGTERSGKVEFHTHGKLSTLIRLEYQGIRQSDGIMFEMIGEVFIPLIIIVMYVVMGIAGDLMEMINELISPTMRNSLPLIVMMVSSGISAISSTSFSREGKVNDILSTMPISNKDRIHGKIIFHMIVETPACILMFLAFSWLLKAEPSIVLSSIPVLIIFVLDSSLWGLLIDLKRTFTTWSEPVEAVKKNMNPLVSFMLTILVTALGFVPYMVDRTISFGLIALTHIVLNLVLASIFYALLRKS